MMVLFWMQNIRIFRWWGSRSICQRHAHIGKTWIGYVALWPLLLAWIKGLRPVLGEFIVTIHEGSPIPRPFPQARVHCDNKKTDRSVLITSITLHFSFHPENISILHVKGDYVSRSGSRFTRFSNCYVTWCRSTRGIVASQYPSKLCSWCATSRL